MRKRRWRCCGVMVLMILRVMGNDVIIGWGGGRDKSGPYNAARCAAPGKRIGWGAINLARTTVRALRRVGWSAILEKGCALPLCNSQPVRVEGGRTPVAMVVRSGGIAPFERSVPPLLF